MLCAFTVGLQNVLRVVFLPPVVLPGLIDTLAQLLV